MSAPVDVLAVMDRYSGVFLPNDGLDGKDLAEARDAVAELMAALRAYDRWHYEVQSARVNGESVYSYSEMQEMREKAAALGSAALARCGGTP